MAVYRDITKRRQAQEALERELRALRKMLRASDYERQLIYCEIHDGLAQQLGAAIMQFQTHERLLRDRHPGRAYTAYRAGVEILQQALAEARRLIGGVGLPILDEQGIAAAISHLICQLSSANGPSITLQTDIEVQQLAKPLEHAIYRIAQEAMTNALQHSSSDTIKLSLFQEVDKLRMEVEDWVVRFDLSSVDEDQFGLAGIRERTRLLGGECSIKSELGKGTCVRVVLPIVGFDSETALRTEGDSCI
jgi:two-component system sensor histidine kinase DegS